MGHLLRIITDGRMSKMKLIMRRVCFLSAVMLISGVSGCSTNPATGRSQLILVSPQRVTLMGEAAAPQLIQQHGGQVKASQLRAYVKRVGNSISGKTETQYRNIQWRFIVLDSDTINAFALPPGKVFLSRGLLERFTNEAQIAAVLAHEIGHITARHVDERLSQVALAQLGVGLVGQATDSDFTILAVKLATEGTLLKFNRDQEREADEQGVKYMTAAGYDPHAMLEVLDVLAEASNAARPPEFLSTHPHAQTRMRTVRGLLQGPYRFTQGNPDFKKYRGRFQRLAGPHLPASP